MNSSIVNTREIINFLSLLVLDMFGILHLSSSLSLCRFILSSFFFFSLQLYCTDGALGVYYVRYKQEKFCGIPKRELNKSEFYI